MRLLASGAASRASLSAAKIIGAGQFIGRVIDHFIRPQLWRCVGPEFFNLPRQKRNRDQQQQLQRERCQNSAVGNNSGLSLTGQRRAGARESRTDRGDELLPARRPLDQQFGRSMDLNDADGVELERFAQVKYADRGCGLK